MNKRRNPKLDVEKMDHYANAKALFQCTIDRTSSIDPDTVLSDQFVMQSVICHALLALIERLDVLCQNSRLP